MQWEGHRTSETQQITTHIHRNTDDLHQNCFSQTEEGGEENMCVGIEDINKTYQKSDFESAEK